MDLGGCPLTPPPPPDFDTEHPDPRVPAESRRGRLQGMLADLQDVDGLPPKPATAGPLRPHEGMVLGVPVPLGGSLCPLEVPLFPRAAPSHSPPQGLWVSPLTSSSWTALVVVPSAWET